MGIVYWIFGEESKLIYNVYILTKDGLCIHHRKYGGSDYDEELVTGFLSTISSFGRNISGGEFDLIVMGNKQFVSISSENLIFAAYSDNGDKIKKQLSKIKEEFIKRFGDTDSWSGESCGVDGFDPVLDGIVGDSGEPGRLNFKEIGKFFDTFKKKPS